MLTLVAVMVVLIVKMGWVHLLEMATMNQQLTSVNVCLISELLLWMNLMMT
jgi:hypothetical protein